MPSLRRRAHRVEPVAQLVEIDRAQPFAAEAGLDAVDHGPLAFELLLDRLLLGRGLRPCRARRREGQQRRDGEHDELCEDEMDESGDRAALAPRAQPFADGNIGDDGAMKHR